MADYCIGDVQGCFDALQALLKKIQFNTDKDRLFFLGDVVNRGTQSLQTLRFIRTLKDNATMVLGNHDFHLLACALANKTINKKDTFTDILNAKDKTQLIDFLRQQPLVIKHKNALMVHAGIPPSWDELLALKQSLTVQKHLKNTGANIFIAHMYNNNPRTWSNDLNALEACRYTINACMRMRFCKADDTLEFDHKMNNNQAPKGYKAWFTHDNRTLKNTNIYFGHWSTLKNINTPHIYPLDTGCVWGNKLSALNLKNKITTSISCKNRQTQ